MTNLLSVLIVGVLCFVGGWLVGRRTVPSDDKRVIHLQSVASAAQGRYHAYKARCTSLEGVISELNRQLEDERKQKASLDAENQDMADLLHDYVAVNACDLHGSQAYLIARVQHLKACGFGLTEVQRKIKGYAGGRAYELIKPIFDGDVSLHRPIVRGSQGSEVHLCFCDDADWKAEQSTKGHDADVYG